MLFKRIATGVAASVLATASARAGFISYLDLPRHESAVSLSIDGIDVSVEAINGTFMTRTKGHKQGTGVKHGAVKRLIDDSEALVFTFSHPVVVDMLALNRLFAASQRPDKHNEMALVSTDAGDYTLEALSRTDAEWSGPGDADEMMHAWGPFGGRRMIHAHANPTGIFDAPVTRIELCSAIPGPRYVFSDFSFVSLEFSPAPAPIHTPAPATLPALAAIGALVGSRRRRRATTG